MIEVGGELGLSTIGLDRRQTDKCVLEVAVDWLTTHGVDSFQLSLVGRVDDLMKTIALFYWCILEIKQLYGGNVSVVVKVVV